MERWTDGPDALSLDFSSFVEVDGFGVFVHNAVSFDNMGSDAADDSDQTIAIAPVFGVAAMRVGQKYIQLLIGKADNDRAE